MASQPQSINPTFSSVESKQLDSTNNSLWSFQVLDAPGSQIYEFKTLEKFSDIITEKDSKGKVVSDGYVYWHGYIAASEVKSKKFPLDANPRKPSPTKITKQMQVTLQKSPGQFHHWNNGMTVICQSVTRVGNPSDNKFELSFGKPAKKHGDGICNGGHTYYSIEQSNLPLTNNQHVRIELVILPSGLSDGDREDIIKDIAQKRNDNNELDETTLAHYIGAYDKFRDEMVKLGCDDSVRWFAGDPDATASAMDASKLVSLLTTIDPYWHLHHLTTTKEDNHMSAARNPGSRHKAWTKEAAKPISDKKLDHMVPLIGDLLEIIDIVSHSLAHDDWKPVTNRPGKTNLWRYLNSSGKDNPLRFHPESTPADMKTGIKLADTYKAMIAGAFRTNVWIGNGKGGQGITLVGWSEKPIVLWNDERKGMRVNYMTRMLSTSKSINAPSFGNAFGQEQSVYTIQLADLLYGALGHPTEKPAVIYSTVNDDKWEKEDDSTKATHYLVVSKMAAAPDKFAPEVEMKNGLPPKKTKHQGYRKL